MAAPLPDGEFYPRPAYAWTVVGILVLTAVLSYTDRQVLSLIVDPIRKDLGIGDGEIGLLIGTAFALVYGTAGIPLGWLADRTSRRNMIMAGIVVWSLATMASGLARDFRQLFVARLFVGLGEAVLSPAAIALISDYFPPARRGSAVGCYLSGIAIGVGGGIFIAGFVLRLVGNGVLAGTPLSGEAPWRLLLIMVGAPGLLWSLAILAIREPTRRGAAPAEAVDDEAVPLAGWLRMAPIYLAVAMASLVDNAVGAWAPSLMIRDFGSDPSGIGIELGLLIMIGNGCGVLFGGVLADRVGKALGRAGKIRLCLAAALLILPVALLIASGHFTAALIGVPVYFALSGTVTASGFSAMLDSVSNRSRGLAMSISFFLNVALGAGLGPTAVTVAGAQLFGPQTGLGAAIAFTIAVGYLIASGTLLLQLKLLPRSP